MMSVTSPALGVARSSAFSRAWIAGRSFLRTCGKHEVLLVADADFGDAVIVHQIGERVHLRGRQSPGTSPMGLSEIVAIA